MLTTVERCPTVVINQLQKVFPWQPLKHFAGSSTRLRTRITYHIRMWTHQTHARAMFTPTHAPPAQTQQANRNSVRGPTVE